MPQDETIFRLLVLAAIMVVAPIGIYFRLKSRATQERLDRKKEGWFVLLTLRPLAALGELALIAYLINPAWMAWSAISLPIWLRWAGVVPGAIATLVMIAVFRALGSNLTDTVVTRREHTLVTHGPYHWVRHPLYTASALVVIAIFLTTANLFIGAVGFLAVLILVCRTHTEERFLMERFGDEYREYMASTGRFVPRRARNRNGGLNWGSNPGANGGHARCSDDEPGAQATDRSRSDLFC